MAVERERWNHNIHYHPLLIEALPRWGGRALDVGCGEGMLARQLGGRFDRVTGIDLDPPSIDLARRAARAKPAGNVEFVTGDVLTQPFEPESFDAIVSVAALHHMDTAAGLHRMRALLRPGGTLAVIGLARSRYPKDLPRDLVAAAATRLLRRSATRTLWHHSAPTVWPPPETFAETRRIAQHVLPGVQWRRLLLWRYLLTWTKFL